MHSSSAGWIEVAGTTPDIVRVVTMKTTLRRLLLLALAGISLGVGSLMLAGPASADVPEELWETPDEVDNLYAILLLGGVPLLGPR